MTPRGHSPIDGFMVGMVKWWCEASGFVNSTVMLFIKLYCYQWECHVLAPSAYSHSFLPFAPACTCSHSPMLLHTYLTLYLLVPFLPPCTLHTCPYPYLIISSLYIFMSISWSTCTLSSISWSIHKIFACNLHSRCYFCGMIEIRGSNPMSWPKLHIIITIFDQFLIDLL